MMKKNNKECITCGKIYTFCNGCSQFDHLPRWMNLYHNENCMNIFEISTDYAGKYITKETAKDKYDACDLSYKDNLRPNIIKIINEAYDVEANEVEPIESGTEDNSIESVVMEQPKKVEDKKVHIKKKYGKYAKKN